MSIKLTDISGLSNLEVRAMAVDWHGGIRMIVRQGNAYAVSVQMEEFNEGVCPPDTLTINMPEAQILLDDLWHAGLRPSEQMRMKDNEGAIAATKKHLDDMRKIVSNKLKIELDSK